MADDTRTRAEQCAKVVELVERLTPWQRKAFMYELRLYVTEKLHPSEEGAAELKRVHKARKQYLRDRREFPIPMVH